MTFFFWYIIISFVLTLGIIILTLALLWNDTIMRRKNDMVKNDD